MKQYHILSAFSWLFALAVIGFMPISALATTTQANVQHVDGSSIVYMDYPTGQDMIVVDNFNRGGALNFDIYLSSTPTQKDSWELARTYSGENEDSINEDYFYGLVGGPAVNFKNDWYFVVSVQSAGEFSTQQEEYQIWRIEKRGGKPKMMRSIQASRTHNGKHQALFVTEGIQAIQFIAPNGDVYRSANGENWANTSVMEAADSNGFFSDVVASDTKVYMSVVDTIYSSSDAETWSSIGNDPCEGKESCNISNIQVRANRGLFAVAEVYEDHIITYELWRYLKGEWTHTDTFNNALTGMYTFGGRTYAMQSRGNRGYSNVPVEIMKDGTLQVIGNVTSGSAMGILSSDVMYKNLKDQAYVTLMSY